MENYRIVERQYPESGDTVYVVERRNNRRLEAVRVD